MELKDRLSEATKAAMKARQAERLSTLRMISAGLKDREIAARGEGTEMTGADQLAFLGKMVKQRQESVKLYEAGNRPELAAKEMAEIAVIEEFLPKQLGEAEVDAAIAAAIAETGAASVKDMGRVMAALKAAHTGQMDFGAAGAKIKARLG
jgi:uncharacterized protein YqeY